MTNDLAIFNSFDAGSDGWADAASDYAENLLRGELLKCTDGHWLVGREGSTLAPGIRLVATGTAAAWVKWVDGKPFQYCIRKPGEDMPDREELGDNVVADWEAGPDGQPRDPWQNTRFCWFVNPETAQTYTFTTSSWSGRGAIIGLGGQIERMRIARPGVAPIVEFTSGPLQTKFGRKMRPVLKIVGWVGGHSSAPPPNNLKRIAGDQMAEQVEVLDDMLEDRVPF